MQHLPTWKKSQAAFRNSSEARPISGILPALIADSIQPAILGNRSSGGSGSVMSRSLSTKDLRFRLRGGESVNIPFSFCMRREIPAKSLRLLSRRTAQLNARRVVRTGGHGRLDSTHVKRVGPGHLYRESGLQILWKGFGESYLHAGPQPITRARPDMSKDGEIAMRSWLCWPRRPYLWTSQEGGDARRPTCSRVQSRPYENAMLRPL